jgi:imidazolonepropionase-like amidohydrolase
MGIRLTNALVIDGTGQDPFLGEVCVKDGAIGYVGAITNEPPKGDDEVIDCKGRTVMPGLVEAHCHISFNDLSSMEQAISTQPEDHALISLANAQMLLQRGFTSLFSAASAKPRLDVAVRDAINSGLFQGPRIHAASQEISPSGNLGDLDNNYFTYPRNVRFTVTADGPEEFTKAARFAARDGVDSIKVNVSGDRDWGHMHADDTVTVITDRELQAVMDVANARKLTVATHCTSSQGVKLCVNKGVHVIYHAVHADEEARDMLEAAKDRVFVAPAVGLPVSMFRRHKEFGLRWSDAKLKSLEVELETVSHCMSDLRKRGVRVLPGGDYGAFITNPIGTNAKDLELFVEMFGFSSMEAVVAATKQGGELMRQGKRIGQIQTGYCADLLILDGNPIENIRILQNQDKLLGVMIEGQFAKRASCLGEGHGSASLH